MLSDVNKLIWKPCKLCKNEWVETQMQEAHLVMCRLFADKGNRKLQKQFADKYPRVWLCETCHKEYDKALWKGILAYAKKQKIEIMKIKREGISTKYRAKLVNFCLDFARHRGLIS